MLTRETIQIYETVKNFVKQSHVRVPYPEPQPTKDLRYSVAFAPPTHINVVGSYHTKTMTTAQQRLAVDMIVVMPRDLFEEKDYANMRYFYRRAYYLACIAARIRVHEADASRLSFEYMHGNPLLPVLLVRRDGGKVSKTRSHAKGDGEQDQEAIELDHFIRIIPCAPDDLFPRRRLHATRGNIRRKVAAAAPQPGADDDHAAEPTPFYNNTLRAESCYTLFLRLHRDAAKKYPAYKDACVLGRIWLLQRGLGGETWRGGFGPFEWATMLALLLLSGGDKGRPILSSTSRAVHIFRGAVRYIATTDFMTRPVVLGGSETDMDKIRESGPVLYDADRGINILYKMTPWSVSMLQRHARWTSLLLEEAGADQFRPTFAVKPDHSLQRFDMVFDIRIPDESAVFGYTDHLDAPGQFCEKLYRTLSRGLGDRARLIHILREKWRPWVLGGHGTTKPSSPSCQVAVIFESAKMARRVDRGPSVEEKDEALRFRKFWGDKSELRRFADGSILEAVNWSAESPEAICEEIVRYLAKRHLSVDDKDIRAHGGEIASRMGLLPTDTKLFVGARRLFDTFKQDLMTLERLPLKVRQVSAISAALRWTAARPPSFDNTVHRAQPMDTVVYFEASGKWPENLVALKHTKTAFLLHMGRLLQEAKPQEITTHLGFDPPSATFDDYTSSFLDVVYNGSVTFRIHLQNDLEESLLSRVVDRQLPASNEQRLAARHSLLALRRLSVDLPLHSSAMAVCCERFPALSPTVRLLSRWFSRHRLLASSSAASEGFSPELVELIAARAFLHPHHHPLSGEVPQSAANGFLRALQFLARWDWAHEPLVVDFTGSRDSGVLAVAAREKLARLRADDPEMRKSVMVVVTRHNSTNTAGVENGDEAAPAVQHAGSAYTLDPAANVAMYAASDAGLGGYTRGKWVPERPRRVTAARMTELARIMCKALRGDSDSVVGEARTHIVDPTFVFEPNTLRTELWHFDLLIYLSKSAFRSAAAGRKRKLGDEDGTSASMEKAVSRFKNLNGHHTASHESLPPPADPIEHFVADLTRHYSPALVFWHDAAPADDGAEHGQWVVCAAWNPAAAEGTKRLKRPGRVGWPFAWPMRPAVTEKGETNGTDDEEEWAGLDEADPADTTNGHSGGTDGDGQAVELDREAILGEILRWGKGWIERIVKREDLESGIAMDTS